jgi:hypothetical protein
MSSEEFREICYDMLHHADAAFLPYCYYDPKLAVETEDSGSAFIDLLMLRERVLALNLAFVRAAKLKRPSPQDPPHDVPRAEARGKTAFEMDNPLEATIYIDEGRWTALDDMMGLDNIFGINEPFNVNNIYVYLLKLQLLERRQSFDAVKGAAEYRQLYDTILNEYNSKLKRVDK